MRVTVLLPSCACTCVCLLISCHIIPLVFSPAIDKLELVECDLEKQNQISPALDNASIVLCCIGASEKEVFDITGPYRIDYQATKNLIDAGKKNFGFRYADAIGLKSIAGLIYILPSMKLGNLYQ